MSAGTDTKIVVVELEKGEYRGWEVQYDDGMIIPVLFNVDPEDLPDLEYVRQLADAHREVKLSFSKNKATILKW
jgi:hypothetical protein